MSDSLCLCKRIVKAFSSPYKTLPAHHAFGAEKVELTRGMDINGGYLQGLTEMTVTHFPRIQVFCQCQQSGFSNQGGDVRSREPGNFESIRPLSLICKPILKLYYMRVCNVALALGAIT